MDTQNLITVAGETAASKAQRIGINTAVKLRWDNGQILTAFIAALQDANMRAEEQIISEALVLNGWGEFGDGWRREDES